MNVGKGKLWYLIPTCKSVRENLDNAKLFKEKRNISLDNNRFNNYYQMANMK